MAVQQYMAKPHSAADEYSCCSRKWRLGGRWRTGVSLVSMSPLCDAGAAASSGSALPASAAPPASLQADSKPAEAEPADSKPAVVHKTEPGDPESMAATAEVAGSSIPSSLTEAERRLLDWHWANLEYGCSARLSQVRQLSDDLPCQAAASGCTSSAAGQSVCAVPACLGQPLLHIMALSACVSVHHLDSQCP